MTSLLRRRFVGAASACALAPRAFAQGVGRKRVLGILAPGNRPGEQEWARLPTTSALAQHGWIAGRTLDIEFAYTQGREGQLAQLAQELVRKRVDLIWARGPEAAIEAARATKAIPIVFTAVAWPVEMGLADSLARPGGNSTGVAYVAGDVTASAKPAEYLKQVAPRARRLVSLWSMDNLRTISGEQYHGMYPAWESAVRALGFDLSIEDVQTAEAFEPAFARSLAARAEAIIALATPLNVRERKRIVDFANRNRLASASDSRWFVEAGGLISYGPDLAELSVSSVRHIDRILRGARPGDIPIELPSRYELAINLRTAKALGLAVPQTVLARADRVIE